MLTIKQNQSCINYGTNESHSLRILPKFKKVIIHVTTMDLILHGPFLYYYRIIRAFSKKSHEKLIISSIFCIMQWSADQMNGELYELLRWSNICTSSFPSSYHLFSWRNFRIFLCFILYCNDFLSCCSFFRSSTCLHLEFHCSLITMKKHIG